MFRDPDWDGLERPESESVGVIEQEEGRAGDLVPEIGDPGEIEELPQENEEEAGVIGPRAARRRDPDEEEEEEEYNEEEFEDEDVEEGEDAEEEFEEDFGEDDDLDDDLDEDIEEEEP